MHTKRLNALYLDLCVSAWVAVHSSCCWDIAYKESQIDIA